MGKKNVDYYDACTMGLSEMKKICFITPDDLSTLTFAPCFSDILKDMDDVTLYTIQQPTIFEEELRAQNWVNIPVAMERYISLFADVKYFWQLFQIIRRKKFDVLITFATKPNIYGPPAAYLAGVPKIGVAVRGLGRTFLPPQNIKDKFLRAVVSWLYRLSFGCSAFAWFTNPGEEKFCLENHMVTQDKTVLTVNAIDVRYFSVEAVPPGKIESLRKEFDISESNKVVIMVARLVWSKGIREFAEAAEILRKRLPDLRFLLVAPPEAGSPQAVPESYIRKIENCANFTWIEFRKDIRDLYALADLAVLPSYYKEGGYPRALLEPMAMGKPVIAADTPDCRAPVEPGKNGFLVPPRDSVALAQRIEQIITNPVLMKTFGQYSKIKVNKEYDDRMVAKKIIQHMGLVC